VYNHQHIFPNRKNDPNDYITLSATGSNPEGSEYSIGTAQGFMVLSTQTSGNLKFSTDQEFKEPKHNAQFYKKSPIQRAWLALDYENYSTSTLIGFTDEATDEKDPMYDGLDMSTSSDLQFYSIIGEDRYSVQATDSDIQNKTIKLGYLAGSEGSYTISILHDELDAETEVYLSDKLNNVYDWDLRKSDYKFDVAAKGERQNDRFVVTFKKGTLSTPNPVDLKDVKISIKENVLSVSLKNNVKTNSIEMYSTTGKLVNKWDGNGDNKYSINNSVSNGVYIIRIYTNEGVFVKKALK